MRQFPKRTAGDWEKEAAPSSQEGSGLAAELRNAMEGVAMYDSAAGRIMRRSLRKVKGL